MVFSLRPRNRWERRRLEPSLWNFDQVFDNIFDRIDYTRPFSTMRADIKEKDKMYILEVELPGIDKENIQIEYRDNVLTILAERKEELREERADYIRRERKYGSFRRSFYVENIDEENIRAKFRNGILKIRLPKLKASAIKDRRIPIE